MKQKYCQQWGNGSRGRSGRFGRKRISERSERRGSRGRSGGNGSKRIVSSGRCGQRL